MTTSEHAILIVDDDRDHREVLAEIVIDMGYLGRTAQGGGIALDLFQASPSDLVFSDVDMADMTGFEFLRRLRTVNERAQHTPVVLMSARADDDLRVEARNAGACDLLAKPVDYQPFARLVRRLLPTDPLNESESRWAP